ncbi:arrestin domain-containing protein 3-like [Anopheles nili]|uniref:arrestin domain-containing protein 3-like n=1 Tax=Anopheles nili TaxID=185578 RepID=UPI00237AC1C2|nr:arrestin domain-containing protein 3-like [Anopheles nili]
MPQSHECEIRFEDNPSAVYFPGQALSGHVKLRILESFKVTGISLHLKGFAEVHWSETSGSGKNRNTTHYRGRQDYINTVTFLQGSHDSGSFDLVPGTQSHPFCYQLPVNLPSSYEGKHGHIRYALKVVLHRPWKIDSKYKVVFNVQCLVNLNENAIALAVPCKMEIQKIFCCWPCASKPLYISVQIPFSGYVAGQMIAVHIEASNRSGRKVLGFSTKLERIVSYISQTPRTRVKRINETVAIACGQGVAAGGQGSWDHHLRVPAIPPTCNQSQLLTVGYQLVVEGNVSGPSINPSITIPITIGTVALVANGMSAMDSNHDQLQQYPVSMGPIATAPVLQEQSASLLPYPSTPFFPYGDPEPIAPPSVPEELLPPPTYEEAVSAPSFNF